MHNKDQHTAISVIWECFPPNRPWGLCYEDRTPIMSKKNEGNRQFPARFRTTEQAFNFIKRKFRGWERVTK